LAEVSSVPLQPRRVRPFEYAEGDSFLHRLNPISKLMMIFGVTALVITFLDPILGLTFSIALYFVAWGAGISKQLVIIYKRVVVLMGGAFATLYFVFYTGFPYIFEGKISALGFVWAASGLYRLANLIGIVAIFAAATRMIELANSLTMVRVPPRVATTVSLAFGSAPLFVSQLSEIVDAYQSRGFKVQHVNPLRRITSYLALLPPTIFATMRRAQWTSVALEMKGFTYSGARTFRVGRGRTLTNADKIVISVNLALIALSVYYARLGLPLFLFAEPIYRQLLAHSFPALVGGFLATISFALFNILRRI
jgi:energy-coupling factor transport system permease protein